MTVSRKNNNKTVGKVQVVHVHLVIWYYQVNLVIALIKRSTKLFDKHPLFSIKQWLPLTWPFNVKSGEKIAKGDF